MKKIVVLTTGSGLDGQRIDMADNLAKRYGACLDVVLLNSTGAMTTTAVPTLVPPGEVQVEAEPSTASSALGAQDTNEARFAGRSDVRLLRIDNSSTSIEEHALMIGRTADLIVASAPSAENGPVKSAIRAILADHTAAVLLLPVEAAESSAFDRVCIAWNGSAECSRAVRHGMPIIQGAQDVSIVMVDRLRPAGAAPMEKSEIEHYLEAHGVKATILPVASQAMTTAEAIIAEAERTNADLLIAGAQDQTGLLHWMNSSVSKDLQTRTPLPLLVA